MTVKIERTVRLDIRGEGSDVAEISRGICRISFSSIDKFFTCEAVSKRLTEVEKFVATIRAEVSNLAIYEEALSLAERTISKHFAGIQTITPPTTILDVYNRADIGATFVERRKEIERLQLAEELRKQDGTGGKERLDDRGDPGEGVRDQRKGPIITTNMLGNDPRVGLKSLLENTQTANRRATEEVAANPELHPQGDILQFLVPVEEPQRSFQGEARVAPSFPSKVSEQK